MNAVDIFFAYAQADEPLRNALEKHLSTLKWQGFITSWYDQKILPGQEWEREAELHLREAHIILLLVSPDFLASDYSYGIEFKKAMERHQRGEATVIPVILRPVDWKHEPLEKLQALPLGGKPVTSWSNQDEGFLSVTEGIRKVVEKIRGISTISSTKVKDKDLQKELRQKVPVETISDQNEGRSRMNRTKTNALVIFANPRGTDSLRLGTEDRAIKEAIKLSQHRRNITLTSHHAATIHDLRRALLEKKTCRILQISGHGTGVGLLLEDEMGGKFIVPQAALADLFRAYSPPKGSLECVILNACYSLTQGKLTSLGIPYTIAMEGSISDDTSIEFSRGFYDAIGAGYDIERAYEEGVLTVKLAAPGAPWASRLLKKGEVIVAENSIPPIDDAEHSLQEAEQDQSKKVQSLIGLAIDLSGSMAESMRNNTGGHLTRLEGFQQSLKRLAQDARNTLQREQTKEPKTSIDIFAYGFGLRGLRVCDLLSLIEVGKHVISKEEVEQLKKDYTREMQRGYEKYKGLGDLARSYGFGGIVNEAELVLRSNAEAEIRRKIMLEVKRRLERQLSSVGDTTLSIEEVANLLSSGEETLANAEELIYGDTPMCEALTNVTQRFERELVTRPKDTVPVLFILSDGEPNTGCNPLPIVEGLKALGITIVSCFVIDQDIANPRTLLGKADSQLSRGAQLMFDMASTVQGDSQYAKFLLKKGWTIYPEARLFVQLNHSEILEEFIQVVVSPLEERMAQGSLPRGM